jgi:hemoglobin/transferrin/lactoferrin receptor protein
MRVGRPLLPLVVAGALLSLTWLPARAESPTNRSASTPQVITNIVVTASRTERSLQDEPSTVYTIGRQDDPAADADRTLPDLLAGTPSVMLQKTSYGQGSPFLRGFTGFRTLCLIDGIRLNNSVFRDGPNQYWNTVDPLSIARSELVMGPGSVLYGSDAIGGTLNAIPLAPPAWTGAPTWEPELFYRGATAERSTVARAQVAARPEAHVGFVGGYSYKEFGDLIGGNTVGKQPHTGYGEQDWDARLDISFNEDVMLTLAHQSVNQDDAWRTHRTPYGIDWQELSHGTDRVHTFDQDRDLSYAKLRALNLEGPVNRAEFTVSRQNQQEKQYTVPGSLTADHVRQGFDVTTWGTALELQSDSRLGELVYGAEYYRDGVDSYNRKYYPDGSLHSVGIQGPVADDAAYETLGLYLQDTLRLCSGWLDVIPGARYTWTRADADRLQDPVTKLPTALTKEWEAFVGSLRVLAPLTQDRDHVLFASVAQGFRAPNLSDLTRLDTARSGELETPCPGLKPEKYLAGEIGGKTRCGPFSGQAAYYYTLIDNMVIRTPTGNTVGGLTEVTKRNSGQGYVQGVEVSARCEFSSQWSARAAGSWMDGKIDSYPTSTATKHRDYLTRLMPPAAELALRWQTTDARYWCEAAASLAARADKLSADDQRDTQRIPPDGTPGYAVYHLRTGAQITEYLRVTLALENICNEDYRIHGSGVNEPGRNLVLTAQAKF